jgi:3-oxoacyl-[acyl-carrier protein] reductase
MDLGLKGRVAIVAAASKGLGLAVATELASEGAEVAICARSAERLEQATQAIREATGRAVYSEAFDVTQADRVAQFVAAVEKRFGRVDICVTNAGGPPAKPFLNISIEEWRTAVELTLLSAVYFAREVLPRMQKNKWGRLVTITSNSVKQPMDNMMLSNSIRSAVTAMAKTLANEWKSWPIRGPRRRASRAKKSSSAGRRKFRSGAWAGRKSSRQLWRFWFPSARATLTG